MRDILRLGLVLMVITAVSGGSLSYVYGITSAIIETRKAAEVAQSMKVVLPSAQEFRALDDADLGGIRQDPRFAKVGVVYLGSIGDRPEGIVAVVEAPGYGGPVSMLVGIRADLSCSGLQVLSQSETPGLGAVIKEESYLSRFVGQGAARPVALQRDGGAIQGLSGATISSRAVVNGVNLARALAEQLLESLGK